MENTDTQQDITQGLSGLRVLSFESRRSTEMAKLIRHYGGEPISAPSMREIPLDGNAECSAYLQQLSEGAYDAVVLMTGVGLKALADAVVSDWPPARFSAALRRATLIARGPKPVAALRTFGLTADIVVPAPNTWREILTTLDAQYPVQGKRIAVQEYGVSNTEFLQALTQRGAQVQPIAIYRWALPEDLAPLRAAIRQICAGEVDLVLFTSATQLDHLFRVADTDAEALLAGLQQVGIASIGPVCSEALARYGLAVDIEPEQPKMGYLVRTIAQDGRRVMARRAKGGTPA